MNIFYLGVTGRYFKRKWQHLWSLIIVSMRPSPFAAAKLWKKVPTKLLEAA